MSTGSDNRSFSILRWSKTCFINSTLRRIITLNVGLALLNVYRNICITDDMILDKFVNNGDKLAEVYHLLFTFGYLYRYTLINIIL